MLQETSIIQAPEIPILRMKTVLGEGPIWEAETETLHFVDIGRNCIHHLHYETRNLTTDYYDGCIGSIALRKHSPGFVAATSFGFAILPPLSHGSSPQSPISLSPFVLCNPIAPKVEDEPQPNRMFNDGVCDEYGRFYAGSKTIRGESFLEEKRVGRVWRLTKSEIHGKDGWVSEEVLDGLTIPNGMGFNKDGTTMYVCDTRAPHILAVDYDNTKGTLSNKRVWVTTPYQGRPDGMCLDDQDRVYVAKWAGDKVTRHLPNGTPNLEIMFSNAHNITAPVFGGPDMDVLFVTTGSLEESGDHEIPEKVSKYVESGSLFAIRLPGVRGVDKRRFRW